MTQQPTNDVMTFGEDGRPIGIIAYAPDGAVKHRTLLQTAEDGRILSSRTVDSKSNLEWMDQHEFAEGWSNRPIATRRTRPDGTMILIRYRYNQDGTSNRIVIAPDGTEIAPEAQRDFLEE